MKTTTVLLLFSLYSLGQIEIVESKYRDIGEVKNGVSLLAKLSYAVYGQDTAYLLTYQDYNYQQITKLESLSFEGQSTLNQLYKLISSVFTDEHKKDKTYEVNFKLGKDYVSVGTYRVMGVTSARIISNGFFYLTEKQLKKLFARE